MPLESEGWAILFRTRGVRSWQGPLHQDPQARARAVSLETQRGIAAARVMGVSVMAGQRSGSQVGQFRTPHGPIVALGKVTQCYPRRPPKDLQRPSPEGPSTFADLDASVPRHTARPHPPTPPGTPGLTFRRPQAPQVCAPPAPRPRDGAAPPASPLGCGDPLPAARVRSPPRVSGVPGRPGGGGWRRGLLWRRGARGSCGARVALAVAALGRGSRRPLLGSGAAAGASSARPAPSASLPARPAPPLSGPCGRPPSPLFRGAEPALPAWAAMRGARRGGERGGGAGLALGPPVRRGGGASSSRPRGAGGPGHRGRLARGAWRGRAAGRRGEAF